MMYILKFILLWLLPPGCIVLLLAAFTVYMFKHKVRARFTLALITLLLYFASLMPVAQILTHGLEGRYMQPANDVKADVIAVLGGGTVSNVGSNNDGALSAIGMNRLIAGARLQHAMNVPLIISGGARYNDEVAEADVAKQVLLDLGIPEQMIYTDSEALNTKQNAENIILVCRENGWQSVAVVTSALHMPRAMQNFAVAADRSGVEVTAYPCDYLVSGEIQLSVFSFVPQAYALELTAMSLKEYLAITADKFL